MSFVPATPIASGKPYDVVVVDECHPDRLEDFIGQHALTIASGPGTSRVQGFGRLDGNGVRFTEKDAAASKDVRVWMIRKLADATFTAEHRAVF